MAGLAFLQRNTDGTDTANPSIAGVNIGAANASRYVIVGICARKLGGGSATLNSATIGGISATIIAQGQADGNQLAWIGANVPTGTTATIANAWSQTMTDVGFATYTCDSISSLTATDYSFSSATPPTYDIDCNAGGIILGISYNRDGGASCSWTGLTEDYDDVDLAPNDWSGASDTFGTAQTNRTITATWVTSSLPKMLVISLAISGSAYTQTLNETAVLVETLTKSGAKSFSEAVALVQTMIKAGTKSVAEVVNLASTVTPNMFRSVSLNETVKLVMGTRIPLTIDHTKVGGSGTITDFPVYVNLADLPAAFFSQVNTDGGNIRIFKSDGVTEVPLEVVAIDTVARTGELWFKGDVSAVTDTVFYIDYGDQSRSMYAANATYGSQNVWGANAKYVGHFNGVGTDSSVAGNNGTKVAGVSTVAGQIGSALAFDGVNGTRVGLASQIPTVAKASSFNISCWAGKPTATSQNIFSQNINGVGLFVIGWQASSIRMKLTDTDSTTVVSGVSEGTPQTFPVDGTKALINYSWDSALQVGKLYINGVLKTGTTANTVTSSSNFNSYIGARNNGQNVWDGTIDEIRIINSTITPEEITTQYNNQSSPSTFYSVGSIEYAGSFIKGPGKVLGDIVTLASDVVQRVTVHVFNEALVLSDTVSKATAWVFNEVVSIVDSISYFVAHNQAINEILSLADNINKGLTRAYNEAISLVATISNQAGKVLNEVATLVDSLSRLGAFARSLSERIGLDLHFQGLKNGVDIRWIRKYASKTISYASKYPSKVVTFTAKHSTKAVTWVKKYLDIP